MMAGKPMKASRLFLDTIYFLSSPPHFLFLLDREAHANQVDLKLARMTLNSWSSSFTVWVLGLQTSLISMPGLCWGWGRGRVSSASQAPTS